MRIGGPAAVVVCCLVMFVPGIDARRVTSAADKAGAADDEQVCLRAESLTLLPPSQPLLFVRVRNQSQTPYTGEIALKVPEPWRLTPATHAVQLAPGAEQRLAFSTAEATESPANLYPVEIIAISGERRVSRCQEIAVASAPYASPVIDGDPGDWKDAIPVTFTTGGHKTTISTFWKRKGFSILVAVEEESLTLPGEQEHFDAVQFALAPRGQELDWSAMETANRFEYLLVPGTDSQGTCCRLATTDTLMSLVEQSRPLDPLAYGPGQVAVRRTDNTTYYECSLPWDEMRDVIQPGEGREFYLSVLVHDPDGTGIRDWGEAAGLWPTQRAWRAWCKWDGAKWNDTPPMDSRTPWGLCSSRY